MGNSMSELIIVDKEFGRSVSCGSLLSHMEAILKKKPTIYLPRNKRYGLIQSKRQTTKIFPRQSGLERINNARRGPCTIFCASSIAPSSSRATVKNRRTKNIYDTILLLMYFITAS